MNGLEIIAEKDINFNTRQVQSVLTIFLNGSLLANRVFIDSEKQRFL